MACRVGKLVLMCVLRTSWESSCQGLLVISFDSLRMRPDRPCARHVCALRGPAGKGRFGVFVWTLFGSVWVGFRWNCARAFSTEIVPPGPDPFSAQLLHRGSDFLWRCLLHNLAMEISIENIKKIPLKTAWPIIAKKEAAGSRQRPKHFEGAVATKGFQEVEGRIPRSRCVGESHELPCLPLHR